MLKLAVEWGKVERLLPKVEMLSAIGRDVTTILLDCVLRPEECSRMRWEDVRDGALHIVYNKTCTARRKTLVERSR